MVMESKIEYLGKCLLVTNGKSRILVIGDLHLGYGEALNKSGILVSRQMFKEVIGDLDETFMEIERRVNGNCSEGRGGIKKKQDKGKDNEGKKKIVDKVVLLGDVKHAFGGIMKQEWEHVLGLFDYLAGKCKKIVVIKGNHDMILKPIARKRGLSVKDYWKWKEFCFLHGHEDYSAIWKDRGIECLIVGHGHPALRLRDGARSEKYKCFLTGKFRGKNMIVVPSFSDWYAGSDPREGDVILAWNVNFGNFEVRAVGEKLEVLDFGLLKKIKE